MSIQDFTTHFESQKETEDLSCHLAVLRQLNALERLMRKSGSLGLFPTKHSKIPQIVRLGTKTNNSQYEACFLSSHCFADKTVNSPQISIKFLGNCCPSSLLLTHESNSLKTKDTKVRLGSKMRTSHTSQRCHVEAFEVVSLVTLTHL